MPRQSANPFNLPSMPNPKDLMAKIITTFHRTMYDLSGGRIGGNLYAMPVLKLTTTGRKSGAKRTTMLTTPLEQGESVVLIASYGGDDRHPAWYHNLVAHPDVEIDMSGRKRAMRARVATGEERDRLWSEVTRKYRNYADYQTRTRREIPVVVLEPR